MSRRNSAGRGDFTPPRSWRRRSWILAGIGLAPMVYLVVAGFGPDVGDSPGWLMWVVWPVCLLVVALGALAFLKRQRANFDRSDPVLKEIKAVEDGLQWTGPIAGLSTLNWEATLEQATAVYPRLKVQSISADQLRADLQTTSGWTTPGTDITVRGVTTTSPVTNDTAPDAVHVFQISNTTRFTRIDGLQAADDLARLVYLLRALTPQDAAGRSTATAPGA